MSVLSSTSAQTAPKQQAYMSPQVMIPLLWLTATFAIAWPAIRGGVFDALSTDDAMRLVEVRDFINGQGWLDLFQYRLDPPGASMHWSRIIDLPLAGLILLLRPLIGTHGAEAVTLFVWPLLLFAIALALVAATARELNGGEAHSQMTAVMLAVLCVPALIHFRPGAIDHHNAQIDLLLAMVLLTAQIERSAVKAALGGLMASLSLAIGVEMLPAIAATGLAVAGLFVWRGASVSRQVAAFGAALAASSLLLASALLPLSSLTSPVCNSLGGPVLLLICGGGIALMIMVGVDRVQSGLLPRVVSGAAAAIALVGGFLWSFPTCVASPYGQLDPLVISVWIDTVAEAMSLATMLRIAPQQLLGFYGFAFITLGFASAALIRSRPSERFRWVLAILTLSALIALAVWELRGAAPASMLAVPIFAASLATLWPTLVSGRRLLLLAVAASPLGLEAVGLAAKPVIFSILKPEIIRAEPDPASSCQTLSDVAPLARLPNGRVMAPIDLGPMILANTDHAVFAAPYHRNNDGNLAMLKLMLAPIPTAHQILSDRRVDYVVICSADPGQGLAKLAPDGLEARLRRGETPDFLEPLEADPAHKLSAWRVRR